MTAATSQGALPSLVGATRRRRQYPTPIVIVACVFLALILLAAAWPGLFASGPNETDPAHALLAPSSTHYFGTDQLGRDILARTIYGARTSIVLGVGAMALAGLVGAAWGLTAALGGRLVDDLLMRFADVILSFPPLLMALLIVALLGVGTVNAMIAVAIALAPGFARIVRVQALVIRGSTYVHAAVALGVRRRSVLLRHIVPNVLGPLGVLATMNVGSAIIAGAQLSFLGLGPQPPAAEWGSMLAQARDYLDVSWAVVAFPGLAIILTIISVSVVGRRLQVRFEGRAA